MGEWFPLSGVLHLAQLYKKRAVKKNACVDESVTIHVSEMKMVDFKSAEASCMELYTDLVRKHFLVAAAHWLVPVTESLSANAEWPALLLQNHRDQNRAQ